MARRSRPAALLLQQRAMEAKKEKEDKKQERMELNTRNHRRDTNRRQPERDNAPLRRLQAAKSTTRNP